MEFSNSLELLSFHWVAYTIYAFMIISVVAWFAYNLTRKERVKSVVKIPFYGYMAFLVIMGVGHHIFTYNAIPWVSQDITRHDAKYDAKYTIEVKDHKWKLPQTPIVVGCGETILFDVISHDLTYGFGLFRQDGTMVLQMQANPGTPNDILWTFRHNGDFDLTSTEYSGPRQYDEQGNDLMLVKHFMKVIGCKEERQ